MVGFFSHAQAYLSLEGKCLKNILIHKCKTISPVFITTQLLVDGLHNSKITKLQKDENFSYSIIQPKGSSAKAKMINISLRSEPNKTGGGGCNKWWNHDITLTFSCPFSFQPHLNLLWSKICEYLKRKALACENIKLLPFIVCICNLLEEMPWILRAKI